MNIYILLAVIVVTVIALAGIGRFAVWLHKASAQDARMTAAYNPDPNNKVSMSVRGWGRSDIEKILRDFRKSYDLPEISDWVLTSGPSDTLTIKFPNDIQPRLLFFLVNYVTYPKNFDLVSRSIGVLAHVIVTAAYGAPDTTLTGRQAVIYVPADDVDYDLVYAKIDTGQAFKISFTNLIWQPVDDARMPNSASGL